MTVTAFPADVVLAICRHMNDDHAADALLIVRTLGGRPGAQSVAATGVDGAGMDFTATFDDGAQVPVRVAFAAPVTERPQVRVAVTELAERAHSLRQNS